MALAKATSSPSEIEPRSKNKAAIRLIFDYRLQFDAFGNWHDGELVHGFRILGYSSSPYQTDNKGKNSPATPGSA